MLPALHYEQLSRGANEHTAAVMGGISETSPRSLARTAGVFQLLGYLTATFGQVVVVDRLVVQRNAAATAANILGHQRLFWLGFASALTGVVFHIAWALLLYDLFKPVNRRVSLFAMFVMLVGCAIHVLATVLYVAPMLILNASRSLSALTPEQLQALAYVFVRVNGYAFNTFLVFFGLWLLLIGFLISGRRSCPGYWEFWWRFLVWVGQCISCRHSQAICSCPTSLAPPASGKYRFCYGSS